MQSFDEKLQFLKNYLTSKFQLEYVEENTDSNLCFVHQNSEMRPEYKISFNYQDLVHFLNNTSFDTNPNSEEFLFDQSSEIYFPKDENIFWKYATKI